MAFPYVQITWTPNVTPLSADNMNHLEEQFDDMIALLTLRGDIIFRGAATWERLAKGTAGYFLGQGANDPVWVAVAQATREIFAFAFSDGANGELIDFRGIEVNGVGHKADMILPVPQDFTSTTSLELLLNSNETGANMHFSFNSYYGAYTGGEDYNEHSETDNNKDIGATVTDRNSVYDVEYLFDTAAIAAGDILRFHVAYSATAIDSNAYITGLRLKYT